MMHVIVAGRLGRGDLSVATRGRGRRTRGRVHGRKDDRARRRVLGGRGRAASTAAAPDEKADEREQEEEGEYASDYHADEKARVYRRVMMTHCIWLVIFSYGFSKVLFN